MNPRRANILLGLQNLIVVYIPSACCRGGLAISVRLGRTCVFEFSTLVSMEATVEVVVDGRGWRERVVIRGQ